MTNLANKSPLSLLIDDDGTLRSGVLDDELATLLIDLRVGGGFLKSGRHDTDEKPRGSRGAGAR